MNYKGKTTAEGLCIIVTDMKVNAPLARRYELYASPGGGHFLPPHKQEIYGTASTDQGNVSYEVPAIHAIYKIETPGGVDNHSPEFAKVILCQMQCNNLGREVDRRT